MDINVLILTTNLVFSTIIFWIIAKLYILPNLSRWPTKSVLIPILLLESTRHLGLMFLAPGASYAGIPALFAVPSAMGDFTASLLALAAIPLVLKSSRAAWPLLWALTVFGTIDFAAAILLATISGAPAFMGPAWWIPALWVPAALMGHYVTFVILLKRLRQKKTRPTIASVNAD